MVADEIRICIYKLTWINSSWMFHCVWPNDRSLGHMVNTHACKHASPAPACTAAAKKSGVPVVPWKLYPTSLLTGGGQGMARDGKGNKDYIELVCVLVEGVLPSRWNQYWSYSILACQSVGYVSKKFDLKWPCWHAGVICTQWSAAWSKMSLAAKGTSFSWWVLMVHACLRWGMLYINIY